MRRIDHVRSQRMAGRQPRVVEGARRLLGHADPAHHGARAHVAGGRDRQDLVKSEPGEAPIERRARAFAGQPLTPAIGRKAPADLDGRGGRQFGAHAHEADHPDQPAVGLELGGPEAETVFSHGYGFSDGYLHISDAPGLGVDIDEAEAAKWPYVRAYLPVNRLRDGTLFNW